jgi:ABC-2 type transport system ATP-binding protein
MRPGDAAADAAGMETVIDVQHVTKSYGGRRAVDDVSLQVTDGEIFAVLGPNGAGKTTLVESIAGLRSVDSGRIHVLGLDPRSDRDELRQQLGIQLQESALPDNLRVREALDLYASFYANPADPRELLAGLGLEGVRNTRFAKLSGGQKQRLSIALALVGNPRIAVLDELTTGLDPQARRDTWELIEGTRARGVTVLLVTHFMEEAERLADRIALIDGGRLVALDTPEGIVRRVDADQQVRFRPSAPFDESILTGLSEVRSVSRSGPTIAVAGSGNLALAVTAALARNGVVVHDLRIEQADLEDAFIALTGRSLAG